MRNADVIRMTSGKKDLPVGLSKTKWGYRLHRSVNGKDYNFGSIQNHELALRLNGYIDIIVDDLRKAQAKEGLVSIDQIREVVWKSSLSDMEEITRMFAVQDSNTDYRLGLLVEQIAKMDETTNAVLMYAALTPESFWKRIVGRLSAWGK